MSSKLKPARAIKTAMRNRWRKRPPISPESRCAEPATNATRARLPDVSPLYAVVVFPSACFSRTTAAMIAPLGSGMGELESVVIPFYVSETAMVSFLRNLPGGKRLVAPGGTPQSIVNGQPFRLGRGPGDDNVIQILAVQPVQGVIKPRGV